MILFDDQRSGLRLRGLDPSGIAEVVQVSGAINLVLRGNGKGGGTLA